MPRHSPRRMAPSANAARRLAPSLVSCALAAAALSLLAFAASAAQSGRRAPQPISPVATPTPTPEPVGESESEGRPKRTESAGPTFMVYQMEGFSYVDWTAENLVMSTFVERLSKSKDLTASLGGRKLTRKEAQEIAKKETTTHVVLVELTEDGMIGPGGMGQADTRRLALKTWVYAPGGSLKFTDHTSQRPLQRTTSIGGVRLPLPVPTRRVERFPNELELEQAARDAADRVMRRFNLRLPPD